MHRKKKESDLIQRLALLILQYLQADVGVGTSRAGGGVGRGA